MHIFRELFDSKPISLLFLKLYAEAVELDPEVTAADAIRTAWAEIYRTYLEDEDVLQICNRMSKSEADLKPVTDTPPSQGPKRPAIRSFGDYFRETIASLDQVELLLWVCDFHTDEARRLYEREDYRVVEELIKVRQRMENEKARLMFEGALFGFGGKYGHEGASRKDEGEVRITDLRNRSRAEIAQFMADKARRS